MSFRSHSHFNFSRDCIASHLQILHIFTSKTKPKPKKRTNWNLQNQTQQTCRLELGKPNPTNAPPPHPNPNRRLSLMLRFNPSCYLEPGFVASCYCFDLTGFVASWFCFNLFGCCGFCFDLHVSIFVLGKLSVKESSSHGTQVCERQVAIVKSSLRNSRC